MSAERDKLKQIRGEFVAQWGALGTQWGINRTMAQVHALLMTSIQPLTTDEVSGLRDRALAAAAQAAEAVQRA